MSLIEWREEFCTGIPGVDYEHEELIKQINSIYALLNDKSDKVSVLDSLGNIYGNISAHFALEEQMMERHYYQYFNDHKLDHERLLDEIRDITEEFESAVQYDSDLFKQKLNDWFQMHFSTHDALLHGLAQLMNHESVSEPAMKTMIRNAKHALLGKSA
ncbi:MAG: hemerythrin family protein [Gammaproteobacteria bacterium]|nr:hemerythrin family protein [Gammaproteobacteria bacterium]